MLCVFVGVILTAIPLIECFIVMCLAQVGWFIIALTAKPRLRFLAIQSAALFVLNIINIISWSIQGIG